MILPLRLSQRCMGHAFNFYSSRTFELYAGITERLCNVMAVRVSETYQHEGVFGG